MRVFAGRRHLSNCAPDEFVPLLQSLYVICTVMQATAQTRMSKDSGDKGIHGVPVRQTSVVAYDGVYASQRVEVMFLAQQSTSCGVARIAVTQIYLAVVETGAVFCCTKPR